MKRVQINNVLWFASNDTEMSLDAYSTRKEARKTLPGSRFTYVAKVRLIELTQNKKVKK